MDVTRSRRKGVALAILCLALAGCGRPQDSAAEGLRRESYDVQPEGWLDTARMGSSALEGYPDGEAALLAPAEEPAGAVGATPGLSPDLASTASLLKEALRSTPRPEAPATGGANPRAMPQEGTAPDAGSAPPGGSRMIVKDASLTVRVADVALGIARLDAIAAQSGGYVLETATDFQDVARRTALMRLAVPVDQFEAALDRIRQAAIAVESESASGTDVGGEAADLRADIANLEATSARVRGFLDRAQDVEEALSVNARLTELEGQVAQRRARLAFLEQRAAYSTIAVLLTEPAPAWTPTATATPTTTPTPSPTATPVPWRPGETVREASGAAVRLGRGLVELGIWIAIVWLPLGLVAALVMGGIVWVLRRVGGRGRSI